VTAGSACQTRQVLADPKPGDRGGDGRELTTDLGGGVRLGVERVDMAGRAREEDQDDRLRPGSPLRGRRKGAGPGRRLSQQRRQADPEQPRVAEPEQLAPGNALRLANARVECECHLEVPSVNGESPINTVSVTRNRPQ